MRLTKRNPETGRYEYIAKPMEYVEYRALTLAALQKLGELEGTHKMSRYIDADKLVAWCNETSQTQSTVAGKAYVDAFLTAVLSCPTADVVEVVRCRDCKYYKPQTRSITWNNTTKYCCRGANVKVNEDDYCSYGERRDNG